jgi:hypothetical protein
MSSKRKARYDLGKHKKKSNRNPNLREQVVPPRGGLLFPGHDFLGPFNPMDYATPRNQADVEAKDHDMEYTDIGKQSYYKFTPGDQKLIDKLQDNPTAGAKAARFVFKAKKAVAPIYKESQPKPTGPRYNLRKRSSQQRITDTFKSKKYRPDKQSVLNLQSTRQATEPMADKKDGKGSNNTSGLTETPVDQVVDVERGVSSYQFASLPWNAVYFAEETKTTSTDIAFRMTSPYDVTSARSVTDQNPNTTAVQNEKTISSDASDTTNINRAMWFDFYAGMYKYYHVVGCKYNILIENMGNEPFWVHKMYCTDRLPPTGASNMDMLGWSDNEPHYVSPIMGYVDQNGLKNSQLISGYQTKTKGQDPQANGNYVANQQINSNKSNILQLSGQYSTGDVTHDIRLDSDVENWTLCTTNPKLREILFLRFKPETSRYRRTDQATDAGRTIRYKLTIKLEYLVEFKELQDALKWPVSYQPLTVNITSATNTDASMSDE